MRLADNFENRRACSSISGSAVPHMGYFHRRPFDIKKGKWYNTLMKGRLRRKE